MTKNTKIKLIYSANKYHVVAGNLKSMYDIFLEIYKNKGDYIMTNLQIHIKNYLEYCSTQKRLDEKH